MYVGVCLYLVLLYWFMVPGCLWVYIWVMGGIVRNYVDKYGGGNLVYYNFCYYVCF